MGDTGIRGTDCPGDSQVTSPSVIVHKWCDNGYIDAPFLHRQGQPALSTSPGTGLSAPASGESAAPCRRDPTSVEGSVPDGYFSSVAFPYPFQCDIIRTVSTKLKVNSGRTYPHKHAPNGSVARKRDRPLDGFQVNLSQHSLLKGRCRMLLL